MFFPTPFPRGHGRRIVRRSLTPVLIATVVVAIATWTARAETLVLERGLNGYEGVADNSMYQELPDNTNGGMKHIYVGASGRPGLRRALIRFDLEGLLPSDAVIQSVELRLVLNQTGNGSVDGEPHSLHRLLRDWGEGTVAAPGEGGLGAPAEPGDATWAWQMFQMFRWAQPGGVFKALPSVTIPVNRVTVTRADPYVFSSEGMIGDVEKWLETPGANFGWILIGDEPGNFRNARRFFSSENVQHRPRLTIEWTMPPNAAKGWGKYR